MKLEAFAYLLIGYMAVALGALAFGVWATTRVEAGRFVIVTPLRTIEATGVRTGTGCVYFQTAIGEKGKVYGNFVISEMTTTEAQ